MLDEPSLCPLYSGGTHGFNYEFKIELGNFTKAKAPLGIRFPNNVERERLIKTLAAKL
jgi:hypothetical protein